MQIKELVLIGYQGDVRRLEFELGNVNVITGASKTGKSSIVEIVDYCLGSADCPISYGVIRDKVQWFGLVLSVGESEILVARECPAPQSQSSDAFALEIGPVGKSWDFADVHKTTNRDAVLEFLAESIGLEPFRVELGEYSAREAYEVSFRHALHLCLQAQGEIANKHDLFHGASDRFVAQALREVLPYLLGAATTQAVALNRELKELGRKQRQLRKRVESARRANDEVSEPTAVLVHQARALGLIRDENPEKEGEAIMALRAIAQTTLDRGEFDGDGENFRQGAELESLDAERRSLLEQRDNVRYEISLLDAFSAQVGGYASEVEHQVSRLRSLGLATDPGASEHTCPVCQSALPEHATSESLGELQAAMDTLESRFLATANGTPRIGDTRRELKERESQLRERIRSNAAALGAIRKLSEVVERREDDFARANHVVGRVSQYLDTYVEESSTNDTQDELAAIVARIDLVREQLVELDVETRLASVLSRISRSIHLIAKTMELEYSDSPVRLDLRDLTVIADTVSGPVPMDKMGSGENWLGYHLAAHLAVHTWLVEHRLPVPNFLVLDQPSQVYFPEDPGSSIDARAREDADWVAVARLFEVIQSTAAELGGGLQVIVAEHANLAEPWFEESVREVWRGGTKLVPDSWPARVG